MLSVRTMIRSRESQSVHRTHPIISIVSAMTILVMIVLLASAVSASSDDSSHAEEHPSTYVYHTANITLGESFFYNKTFKENNLTGETYLQKANASVIDNEGESHDLEEYLDTDNSSIIISYTPENVGPHNLTISYLFANHSYYAGTEFFVMKEEPVANVSDEDVEDTKDNLTFDMGHFGMGLDFDETYYFDPEDPSFNGTAHLLNISSIDRDLVLDMVVSPLGSERNFSCVKTFYMNTSFSCEFPSSALEIAEYELLGTLTYRNITREFDTSFDLKLDESDLMIDMAYSNFINFSETQEILVNMSPTPGSQDDAQVMVEIIHPDGSQERINMTGDEKGNFIGDFVPSISGIHDIEVVVVSNGQYATLSEQFRVMEDDTELRLQLPSSISHNYGKLNLTGNVTLTESGSFIDNDIKIYYSRMGRDRVELCSLECKGFCPFSCTIEGLLEYSSYNVTAETEINNRTYSDWAIVDITLDESDIELDVSYPEEALIGQRQNFFVEPSYQGIPLDEGSMFAEITDPLDIVYRITPERIQDGYAFSFIGLEPGIYALNMTFVSPIGYISEVFEYEVFHDIAEITDDEQQRIISRDRKLRDTISENLLEKVVESDADHKHIQLPSNAHYNISWAILGSNVTAHSFEKKDFIPETIERLRLSEYVSRSTSERFKEIELYYAETSPLEIQRNKITDDLIELLIPEHSVGYSGITLEVDLLEISKAPFEKIIVKDKDTGTILSGIDYSKDDDGLVRKLGFEAKNLSSRYVVEVISDRPFFNVDYERRVRMKTPSIVTVDFKNPDVSVADDTITCDIVVENITQPMIPSPRTGTFVFRLEYDEPGEKKYTVFCGSHSVDKEIMITEPRRPESFSQASSSIRKNATSRLLMSYNKPQHYKTPDGWKEIDPRFYPVEGVDRPGRADHQIERHSIEYIADRGLFSVKMGDLDQDFPFVYEKDGHYIMFSIEALSLFNTSSGETLARHEPREDTPYHAERDTMIYEGIFGEGTKQIFTYSGSELKSELLIDKNLVEFIELEHISSRENITLMFEYSIYTGDLRIDPQSGKHDIPLRTQAFEDTGIRLLRDYYHPESNISARRTMYRSIEGDAGNYTMVSELPFNKLFEHERLVIDPTFSIGHIDRDAMSIDNTIVLDYYSEESQYLRFGLYDDEIYQTGLQFQLDVPFGSTIEDAYLVLVAGDENPGDVMNVTIMAEDISDAHPFVEGSGNISSRDYLEQSVVWETDTWTHGSSYESTDIAPLIQEIVDDPGWSSGNNISLMLKTEDVSGDSFRSIHGYSSPGDNYPVLILSYESDESAPSVILHEPDDGAHLSQENVNFSYIPEDEDGIDYCELWGDFDGEWRLNQTHDEPVEGEMNHFEEVQLDEGEYTWNVWCMDLMGNAAFNDSGSSFVIDKTSPSIDLLSPDEDEAMEDLRTHFSFVATDPASEELYCNITYGSEGSANKISDITVVSGEPVEIVEANLSVGNYSWHVSCEDKAGNLGTSDTRDFMISRPSYIEQFSDSDIHANYSVDDDIRFFANYTNSTGNLIEDAECSLIMDEEYPMQFDNEYSLYAREHNFNGPYNHSYTIECSSDLYDTASKEAWVYIYPIVSTVGEKAIDSSSGIYLVDLSFVNIHNVSVFANLTDFLPIGFDASFDEQPDYDSSVSYGGFMGTLFSWGFVLDAGEQRNISYEVIPVVEDYSVSGLYMTGMSAVQED